MVLGRPVLSLRTSSASSMGTIIPTAYHPPINRPSKYQRSAHIAPKPRHISAFLERVQDEELEAGIQRCCGISNYCFSVSLSQTHPHLTVD